jgi:hypothetical protein
MPPRTLSNPAGVWGLPANAEQQVMECVNTSGGTLQHGDVVVIDNSAGQMPAAPGSISGAVTTTTTAKDPKVLGVVTVTGDCSTSAATVPVGGVCMVVIFGVARVQIGAGAAPLGSFLQSAAVAKQAAGVASGSIALTDSGTIFGVALEAAAAKDANNTIRALIRQA